ncbi:group I truncated hemoglobin [Psychrosphaera haliotis]|uniref:Group 1 truncated hemoglobin n=1 Tax=Psychrosphaera haliotis TaxID=555083 RepID=A0A6N8F7J5_9GAMM|nr:group 1 truncated hemoglobin [Psychrosphaera haliotis]MUH72536.1 group 1 truncated hemoglobin [Psychrosphaera haliotis]
MKNSIIFIIALLLSACSTTQNSLYEEIGGKETLSNVFGLAVSRIYNDPTIGHYFKNVPKRHLRMHLTNQVCELIGGPCKYDGEKMETSHQGHNISDKEFFILVEYVQGAMRDIGLTPQQENRIIATLAPLKSKVVYR